MNPPRTSLALAALLASVVSAAAEPPSASSLPLELRPGDDFDRFANASWMSKTAIPAGEQSFGPTAMLRALNAERIASLLENAALPAKRGGNASDRALEQRVGDFYATIKDGRAIARQGLSPLRAELA